MMLRTPEILTLIPGGLIQFVDTTFDLTSLPKRQRYFYEYSTPHPTKENFSVWQLLCLEEPTGGNPLIDRTTNEPAVDPTLKGKGALIREESYQIRLSSSLQPFLGSWIPIPVFRRRHQVDGEWSYSEGPIDWARIFIQASPSSKGDLDRYTATMAFDTHLEEDTEELGDDHYPALRQSDVAHGAEFGFCGNELSASVLLNQGWFRQWVNWKYEASIKAKRNNRPLREGDIPFKTYAIANYITFLDLLQQLEVVPRFRFVNVDRETPVDVGLVLDVGNSRTCGLLIETGLTKTTVDLEDSYRLSLRDISSPGQSYAEPFRSIVEFAPAEFAPSDLKDIGAQSGRQRPAFEWPSPARTGEEAGRLALLGQSREGKSGLSSPKRYLWDVKPCEHIWRFNRMGLAPNEAERPVNTGTYVQYINDAGLPIIEGVRSKIKELRLSDTNQVMRPLFSRSSLMMFLLVELITQALHQINAPQQREARSRPDVPRRLRRIILTVPVGMTVTEKLLFKQWAQWAVDTTWAALDWHDMIGVDLKHVQNKNDYRLTPQIDIQIDEATATQLTYLYNEISFRLGGMPDSFFRLRVQQDHPQEKEVIRIASLDIGGGTTDLVICRYENIGVGAGCRLQHFEEFREGLRTAGDDIHKAIIESCLLSKIVQSNHAVVRTNLRRLSGGIFGEEDQELRQLRLRASSRLWAPLGLLVMERYAALGKGWDETKEIVVSLNDLCPEDEEQNRDLIQQVASRLFPENEADSDFRNFKFQIPAREIEKVINAVLERPISAISEVIHTFGCDLVLLSGRVSTLPAVQNLLISKLCCSIDSVITMSDYFVGEWYPFRTVDQKISDPKTTVCVGAMLFNLAKGQLMNFSLESDPHAGQSVARYIGLREQDGTIRADQIFLKIKIDSADEYEAEKEIQFDAPLFIGFRQLDLERWPSTPFYHLRLANSLAEQNSLGCLPYKIELSFTLDERDELEEKSVELRSEGRMEIVSVSNKFDEPVRKEDLALSFQTLTDETGYWMDTGVYSIP